MCVCVGGGGGGGGGGHYKALKHTMCWSFCEGDTVWLILLDRTTYAPQLFKNRDTSLSTVHTESKFITGDLAAKSLVVSLKEVDCYVTVMCTNINSPHEINSL